jgi:hypothetical protein
LTVNKSRDGTGSGILIQNKSRGSGKAFFGTRTL